ncbi:MAG: pyridoxal phosphate-dependent aminotransferase, partial [Clostridia bacterium]
ECMALAIQALQPSQVGVVYPCFSEYTELSGKYGARVKEIYGSAPDYKPALEALETLIKDTDLVFIGSPNNPTGVTYEREELHALARASEAAGTWLVVDEAFLDFVDPQEQHSLLTELDTYPHVIIIRSMTKMFAIPGLRLGYAVAQPEVINRMKRKQITWSVNQLALLAGEVCLKEDAYVERTRQLISQERHALQTTLVHEFGWEVTIGAANFLLIRLPEYMTAEWMQDHLGQCGIMIRNCAMYPGLTAQHFRIAVRGRQENERLLAAFRQQLAEGRKSK